MQLTPAAWYGEEIAGTGPKRRGCGRTTEEPIRPDIIHPNHLGDRQQVLRHDRLHTRADPQVPSRWRIWSLGANRVVTSKLCMHWARDFTGPVDVQREGWASVDPSGVTG